MTDNSKGTNLLCYKINYVHKKFYDAGPQLFCYVLPTLIAFLVTQLLLALLTFTAVILQTFTDFCQLLQP
jgi:hypothetical protein